MELDTAASTIEVTDTGVLIRWSDGARSRFHSLWLRDNCPSSIASLTELNPDVFVMFAERNDDGDLAVEFSDGHESAFSFEWLQAHSHEPHELIVATTSEPFRAGHRFDEFTLPEQRSTEHARMLDSIDRWGAAILTDVPSMGIDEVAALIGPLRASTSDTIADLYADIDFDGDGLDGAGLANDPRTFAPWRSEPDGIVIVMCEAAAETGGEFVLVDGIAIANELQDDDPDTFDLLSQTSINFACANDPHHVSRASLISVDRNYRVSAVRFDETSLAPLDIEPRQIDDYYRGLIIFSTHVNDPGRAVQVRLEPGQALVIDNHRVLTGNAAVGLGCHQHHQQCSVERDWFEQQRRDLQAASRKLDAAERNANESSLFA